MKSSNKQINELKDKARSGQMDDGISFEDVELGDDNFNQYWKDVHPKIREEKSGILNRAIDGWKRLNEQGDFKPIPESDRFIHQMLNDSDPFRE